MFHLVMKWDSIGLLFNCHRLVPYKSTVLKTKAGAANSHVPCVSSRIRIQHLGPSEFYKNPHLIVWEALLA